MVDLSNLEMPREVAYAVVNLIRHLIVSDAGVHQDGYQLRALPSEISLRVHEVRGYVEEEELRTWRERVLKRPRQTQEKRSIHTGMQAAGVLLFFPTVRRRLPTTRCVVCGFRCVGSSCVVPLAKQVDRLEFELSARATGVESRHWRRKLIGVFSRSW